MFLQLTAITLSQPVAVFASPSETFNTFRIPSLVYTSKKTLLAICEGRQSQKDAAKNEIILKRSGDEGKSWLPMQIVAKMDGSLNNPCVVEAKPGRLVMHFQFYPKDAHEFDSALGKNEESSIRGFQVESLDEGLTWSTPRDITNLIKFKESSTIASGPGVGIRLERGRRKGRIVMPYNQRVGKRWTVYTAFSDDAGKTWRKGTVLDQPTNVNANEVQLVELSEGGVLLNARNQSSGGLRCIAVSHDAGENFSPVELDTRMTDPVCQASIVRLSWPTLGQPGVIAFSNPFDAKNRKNGMLQLSYDEGRTWPRKVLIEPDSFAYSCLTRLSDDRAGILYEKVDQGQYKLLYRTINWR